jgi:hypothetical protein
MSSLKNYMVNLNEQLLPNLEIEQAVSMIAAICPYQDRECALEENIKLTPSENGTGWFFECKVCEGAKCTGFLRDD